MRMFAVSSFVLMAVVAAVNGAVRIYKDGCPDGKVYGESWQLPGCEQCTCYHGEYACYSCGVQHFEYDKDSCYVWNNPTEKYPECCTRKLMCKGHEGFDESKLQPDRQRVTEMTGVTEEFLVPEQDVIIEDPDLTEETVTNGNASITEEPATTDDSAVTEELETTDDSAVTEELETTDDSAI